MKKAVWPASEVANRPQPVSSAIASRDGPRRSSQLANLLCGVGPAGAAGRDAQRHAAPARLRGGGIVLPIGSPASTRPWLHRVACGSGWILAAVILPAGGVRHHTRRGHARQHLEPASAPGAVRWPSERCVAARWLPNDTNRRSGNFHPFGVLRSPAVWCSRPWFPWPTLAFQVDKDIQDIIW